MYICIWCERVLYDESKFPYCSRECMSQDDKHYKLRPDGELKNSHSKINGCSVCHSSGHLIQCYYCTQIWTCDGCMSEHREVCEDTFTQVYKEYSYKYLQWLYDRKPEMFKKGLTITTFGIDYSYPLTDYSSQIHAFCIWEQQTYDTSTFIKEFGGHDIAKAYLNKQGSIKKCYSNVFFFLFKQGKFVYRIAFVPSQTKS